MTREELVTEINKLDEEITELKSDFCIEHLLPNEGDEQLETIVAKAIKFGELDARRYSF